MFTVFSDPLIELEVAHLLEEIPYNKRAYYIQIKYEGKEKLLIKINDYINNNLEESSGGGGGGDSSSQTSTSTCPIGKVIYEGKDVPQLVTLREIRDNVLRKSIVGNAIIDFHYSSIGSKIEHFAYSFSPIKNLVRKTLDSIAENYEK